jgi:hypothetical protein
MSSSPLRRVEEDGAFSGPGSCGEGVWVSIPVVWEGLGQSVGDRWGELTRIECRRRGNGRNGAPEAHVLMA